MSDQNPLATSLRLLWEGLPDSERGPKPKLSLDQIVQAGIALADSAGLEALSMRRLAQELGVGTMSLYRYVPSKTELLSLMLDAVMGPDHHQKASSRAGWRRFLEATAWGDRKLYLAHPWALQANWTRPVIGPNSMAEMELILTEIRHLPLTDQQKMNVVTALDSYVMGAVRQELLWQSAAAESGMSDHEFWRHQVPTMEQAMTSGRFPTMAELSEDTFDGGWEDSFAAGLELLLDGLESRISQLPSEAGPEQVKPRLFGPEES